MYLPTYLSLYLPIYLPVYFVFQGRVLWVALLSWNLLYSPGWPWTHGSTCLRVLSSGIKDMCKHCRAKNHQPILIQTSFYLKRLEGPGGREESFLNNKPLDVLEVIGICGSCFLWTIQITTQAETGLIIFYLFGCLCGRRGVYMLHCTAARGWFGEVSSSLPPCGLQGPSSIHQAWWPQNNLLINSRKVRVVLWTLKAFVEQG